MATWLDISTLTKRKRSDAAESYHFSGPCPTPPCTLTILPFELQARVQATDSGCESYTKLTLAAF